MVEIWALLPLETLGKLACVACSWNEAYKKRLDDEQQKLQDLVAAHGQTTLQQGFAGLKRALPVFERSPAGLREESTGVLVCGSWRQAPSVPGPSASIPFTPLYGNFAIQDDTLDLNIFVCWRTLDNRSLELQVIARAMSKEGLEGLIGLLLQLSQDLRPGGDHEVHEGHDVHGGRDVHEGLQGLPGPYFYFSSVVCSLPFKTGWSMWAPLAPLMDNLCFWPEDPSSYKLPKGTNYISLFKAEKKPYQVRPVRKVHVLAPGWEPKPLPSSNWKLFYDGGVHDLAPLIKKSALEESPRSNMQTRGDAQIRAAVVSTFVKRFGLLDHISTCPNVSPKRPLKTPQQTPNFPSPQNPPRPTCSEH